MPPWPIALFPLLAGVWPLSGNATPDTVQDPYGPRLLSGSFDFHRGLDLQGDEGDSVHAVVDGEVVVVETAAESATTWRERFGTWILIQHADLADGTPVHSAYLHLSETRVAVGDKVVEGQEIGAVGNSGEGISSMHLHLYAYHGLSGTTPSDDNAVSPYRLLDYAHSDDVSVAVTGSCNRQATVSFTPPELDLVRVEFTGSRGALVADLETEEGLCGDSSSCDGLRIEPADFKPGDASASWWFQTSGIGSLQQVKVYDVRGEVATWSR